MSDGAKEIHAFQRRSVVLYRFILTALVALGPLHGVAEAKKKDKAEKAKAKEEAKAEAAAEKERRNAERARKPSYTPFSDNAVGFRGVGEIWQESAVVMVHRSSRFGGTGFFSTGITPLFGAEVELGYNRMVGKAIDPATNQQTSGQATLELVPVAMNVTVRSEGRSSEVFAGFGPAFVAFNDRSPTNAISGMKLGLDMRLGIRIHTNFIQQSMRPGAGGFKRMDVELLLGRRQHQAFGFGSGLDLSAWRVGGGLVCRL